MGKVSKKIYILPFATFCMLLMLTVPCPAKEVKITVSAEDNSGGSLWYAIDDDQDDSFQESNTFTVKEGSTHTVYIKDSAGNVASKEIEIPAAASDQELSKKTDATSHEEDSNKETIPTAGLNDTLEQQPSVHNMQMNSGYSAALTAPASTSDKPDGSGTVIDNTTSTGLTDYEKKFYTIDTKDEHTFYMIVDNAKSTDNVYLLDTVTDDDLKYLTAGAALDMEETAVPIKESMEVSDNTITKSEQTQLDPSTEAGINPLVAVLLIILFAAAGGALYFIRREKIKMKKDELDAAPDFFDDFEPLPDEEQEPDEIQENDENPKEDTENQETEGAEGHGEDITDQDFKNDHEEVEVEIEEDEDESI